MHARIAFAGSEPAELFSREIEASFAGVLSKNYLADPARGPVGFVTASVDGRPWHDTMWSRDIGTFLRELVHYGAWDQARQVWTASLQHVEVNADGFLTFPMYVRMGQRASGAEVDGTALVATAAVLLWERLPATDPLREEIAAVLTGPSSPLRFFLQALERAPFVAGSGEFGAGLSDAVGLYYNVVQNAQVAWALDIVAARLQVEEPALLALRAQCRDASTALQARMAQRFVSEAGTWYWCLDPATGAPAYAVIDHEHNRGFGGINGVFTHAADVHGFLPLSSPAPWVLPSLQTFWALLCRPKRLEQFQRYGLWTQFDVLREGLLTSPAYGHGYALQMLLLMDRPELYTRAANWLAAATVEPGYPLDRASPYWFYERYYSPERRADEDLEGCGALNLVNVSEPLKVARLMIGVDDHRLDPVWLVPRLPVGWTHAEAAGLPVHTADGHALLDLEIDADGGGAIMRVQGHAASPLPALAVRLGTADRPRWRTLPAGTQHVVVS